MTFVRVSRVAGTDSADLHCPRGAACKHTYTEAFVRSITAFLRNESGAAAAEYALILAIVGAGIGVAAAALGGAISGAINGAAGLITVP